MDKVIWWLGAIHAVIYVSLGTVYAATWLMHRALKWLGLWRYVYLGLNEIRKRDFHGA